MSDRKVDLEICEDFWDLTKTDCLLTLGDDIRLTQQAEISKILRENEEIKNKLEQRVERHSRPKRNLVAMLELAGTVSSAVKSLYDFIKPEEVKNADRKFAELKAEEKEIMADNNKQMHAIQSELFNITRELEILTKNYVKMPKIIHDWDMEKQTVKRNRKLIVMLGYPLRRELKLTIIKGRVWKSNKS